MRVVLKPDPMEFGLAADDWHALAESLAEKGFDVELHQPREYRAGGWTQGAGTIIQVVGDAKEVASYIGAIITAVKSAQWVKAKASAALSKRGRSVTFLVDGELWSQEDLSDDDSPNSDTLTARRPRDRS